MKFYILKSLLFIFLFFVPLLFIEYNIRNIPNSYSVKKGCLTQNASRLKLLVLGSSQAEYDINPRRMDTYSCNLANANQDLYYDEKILDSNLQKLTSLKLVILPVSYFSLEFSTENTDEYWRKFFYYYYFNIRAINQNPFDIRNYSLAAAYSQQVTLSFIRNFFNVNLTENLDSSGWHKEIKTGDDAAEGAKRARLHTKQMDSRLFETNVSRIEKIINELKNKNAEVVIISLPVSRSYSNNINAQKYINMQEEIRKLTDKYGLKYFNYFNDQRFIAADFSDSADHLNQKGSKKLMGILREDFSDMQININ